jgi:hypothetical protein
MNAPNPKLSIGGLKLSLELAQICFYPRPEAPLHEMVQCLADKQVNLTEVSLEASDGCWTGSCCIAADDRLQAEQALRRFEGAYEMLAPVGTLTIYPHQSRPVLIGQVLSALGRVRLPIYGIASSLSSLVITTDYRRLDEALSAVCSIVTLPDNHAPFRPEFRVKQL